MENMFQVSRKTRVSPISLNNFPPASFAPLAKIAAEWSPPRYEPYGLKEIVRGEGRFGGAEFPEDWRRLRGEIGISVRRCAVADDTGTDFSRWEAAASVLGAAGIAFKSLGPSSVEQERGEALEIASVRR